MASASDRLTYFKKCLEYDEYDKYNKYKYIDDKSYYKYIDDKSYSPNMKLREMEQKLNGLLFDCPRCTKNGVRVTVDRDLFKDNYFIRALCRHCGAYNSMQISSFALQRVKEIDLVLVAAVKDTIFSLRDTIDKQGPIDKDLDAMIDEDWKLAGSQ